MVELREVIQVCRNLRPIRLGWLFFLSLAACGRVGAPPPDESPETLVVLTRVSTTTYYEEAPGERAGLEYELISDFARHQHVSLRFVFFDSIDGIVRAVAAGEGDLAAAGLTKTESRSERFLTGPEYQTIEERVVCGPDSAVRVPSDLVGKRLRIIAGSSYDETLHALQEELPELVWQTTKEESTEELLRQVWSGVIDCTIADSSIVSIERRYLPELRTPFAIGEPESLVWLVSDRREDLIEPLNEWFQEVTASGRLQALLDKYYSHVEEFDYFDTAVFLKRIEQRLPSYQSLFEAAAREAGIPWTLLAAVSYQESHWDPVAESVTGVRGLMMLTEKTAAELGIADRVDPKSSVFGGARYLAQLESRLPLFIDASNRRWMALSAYNVGYGHLQDARRLAIELKQNPNTWSGVKVALPKLTQRRYYRRLRYGYARGHEPVIFVEKVRNYYDLLEQMMRSDEEKVTGGVALPPRVR